MTVVNMAVTKTNATKMTVEYNGWEHDRRERDHCTITTARSIVGAERKRAESGTTIAIGNVVMDQA